MQENFKIDEIVQTSEFLNTVLESSHSSVFLITEHRKIKALNTSGEALLNKNQQHIINTVFGNALDCMNTEGNKIQCGYSSHCKDCSLLNTVNYVAQNRKEVIRDTFDKKDIVKNNEIIEKYFMYSAKPLRYEDEDMILLIIDDITELEKQKQALKERNNQILSSIRYAKRIQDGLLPGRHELLHTLQDCFLLYQPRDIIGGDFYWATQAGNKTVIAVGDCTGHGIPGALLTILGITTLNEIVKANSITAPDEILNKLREQVINELYNLENTDIQDGLDISVCTIDTDKKVLQFAGANNDVLYNHNNEIKEIKGDKMPVGRYDTNEDFKLKEYNYTAGDTIYLFSDGFKDQFGGNRNKKYGKKRFKNILKNINNKDMQAQKDILETVLKNWKKSHEQIDDIIVLGNRLR